MQFQADETGGVGTTLSIQAENTDNATTFVNTNGNVSTRPRTAASVAWSPPAWTSVGDAGAGQRTSDLAAVIQEIVSRPGWSSGNSLALIVITSYSIHYTKLYD